MTDSEKLDLLIKEVQALQKNLVPAVKRIEGQIKLMSEYLLSHTEIQKITNVK